jgi:hypothetical protein
VSICILIRKGIIQQEFVPLIYAVNHATFAQSTHQEVTKSLAEELSLYYSNVLTYTALSVKRILTTFLTADAAQIINSLIFLSSS